MKSIELCVARFDDDTKESFLDLYTKIDAGLSETTVEDNEKADGDLGDLFVDPEHEAILREARSKPLVGWSHQLTIKMNV